MEKRLKDAASMFDPVISQKEAAIKRLGREVEHLERVRSQISHLSDQEQLALRLLATKCENMVTEWEGKVRARRDEIRVQEKINRARKERVSFAKDPDNIAKISLIFSHITFPLTFFKRHNAKTTSNLTLREIKMQLEKLSLCADLTRYMLKRRLLS